MPEQRVIVGHVLDVLRSLPERSIHAVCTSPPYFGLRSYSTEPQVWGGDDPACAHEWQTRTERRASGKGGNWQQAENGEGLRSGKPQTRFRGDLDQARAPTQTVDVAQGFCRRCNAWLGELGSESSVALFIEHLVAVFAEVHRVLRDDGTCWLNIGDSYSAGTGAGRRPPTTVDVGGWLASGAMGDRRCHDPAIPAKNLLLVPQRLAIALQDAGWYVRSIIIWAKTSCMPESVTDRPTTAHEYILLLSKAPTYFFDAEAIREPHAEPERGIAHRESGNPHNGRLDDPGKQQAAWVPASRQYHPSGRNSRSVWTLSPSPFTDWVETARRVRVEPDDADDDTGRITSPDCPLHVGQSDRVPISRGGERASGRSVRSPGTDGRPAQAPVFGSAPTGQLAAPNSADGSSGSPPPSDSLPANGHSMGSRRTAVPSVRCDTAGGEIPGHTEYTSPSGAPPEQGDCDTPEPFGTPDRTSHIGACTCSYYREVTESISHFATFPPELPRRAILAGTSERGCCSACGVPWRRVTERRVPPSDVFTNRAAPTDELIRSGSRIQGQMRGQGQKLQEWREAHPTLTVDWLPSCRCDAGDPVPCTVLDPFSGSGTTGVVAAQLGRNYVGVELNSEYAEMSLRRIEREGSPLFSTITVEANGHESVAATLPMFGETA